MKKNTIRSISFISIGTAILLLAFMAGGCVTEPSPGPVPPGGTGEVDYTFDPAEEIETLSFDSVEQYQAFIRTYGGGQGGYAIPMMRGGFGAEVMEQAVMEDAVSIKTTASAPAPDLDFSGTNVQVESVDEADLLKTDGEYIYTISGKRLHVIKAYPGEEAKEVSTIEFDSQPSELFIQDDQLMIFGEFRDLDWFKEMDILPRQGMTFVNVYDVSDREDPVLIKEYKFEGNYFRGRMLGSVAYIVTRTQPIYRIGHPTPIIVEDEIVRSMPVSDIAFFPFPYRNPQLVTVHAIDFEDLGKRVTAESVMVEYGQNLYMSEDSMYITYTEYINEWDLRRDIIMDLLEGQLSLADKAYISKIDGTDADILSKAEKENKIYQIFSLYMEYMDRDEREDFEDEVSARVEDEIKRLGNLEFTVINKLRIDGTDIRTVANGKVPGHIINQFSMDEDDGIFRIATTLNRRWSSFTKTSSESLNNIYVLDNNLELIGSLEDIAEGESIFSTRFIEDRLYMVTFRQVDPFFVIDLSNPTNPKKLGELKIPGFSRYLHPYDEDVIIGIGQDATEQGRTRGLKVSLFDVSDVSNPEEIASYVSDERFAQTSAQYEHRAFLFSKEKDLLVIPAWNFDYRNQDDSYNGAMVFHITKEDIELRGLIDHSMGTENHYQPQVQRSLYIEELLYTKSSGLLRINELDDLDSVKDVRLEGGSGNMPIY